MDESYIYLFYFICVGVSFIPFDAAISGEIKIVNKCTFLDMSAELCQVFRPIASSKSSQKHTRTMQTRYNSLSSAQDDPVIA